MDSFEGRVAVITGGGGGIGLAMGARFASQGAKVVLADIQPAVLDTAVGLLRNEGADVIGVPTDVADLGSVEALRDAALSAFGGIHVLCNNAGIGAGAEGAMWDHEMNDWHWAIGVNLYGVIHGINAFVPAMLASGEPGHIVNTSSGNGGVSPLVGTPQYAVTKAAVVTLTECLYGQLKDSGSQVSASVLFPGPHILRTGLFESWRSRPDRWAKERPRQTPYTTVEALESQMKAAGVTINYTDPADVADAVADAILADQFWIHPGSDNGDAKMRARFDSMLTRANPAYLRSVPG